MGRYFTENDEKRAGTDLPLQSGGEGGRLLSLVPEDSVEGGASLSPFSFSARLRDAFSGRTGAEAQAVADALKRGMVRAGRLSFSSGDLLRACQDVPRGKRGDFQSFVAKWASE